MSIVCGIYGFEITTPIDLPRLRIEPRTNDYRQAKQWARDTNSYHLTAVVTGASMSDDMLFDLEAVLSFIERLDVLVSAPVEQGMDDPFAQFVPSITMHKRDNGGGAVIGEDSIFGASRGKFILKALDRLQDKEFCEQTKFRILFFKYVETFRQRKPFIEVTYFLLFSGLESYARAVVNDRDRDASEPISKLLIDYGFDVQVCRPKEPQKAISTYTHLRNALFHNSEFSKSIDSNGVMVEYKLFDYLFNFSQLVALVIFKAVGFDDGHINWNSWIDRQQFK